MASDGGRLDGPPPESQVRLVVGLGNPGDEYRGTRHNIGFEVVDHVADALGLRFDRFRARGDAGKALGHSANDPLGVFHLLKPATFMNLSGSAVVAAAVKFKVPPAAVLIVCDDFNLPLGRIRVRPKGSAGGHNGLKSIIALLATDEFPRVRVGIGESPGSWPDFVLSRFTREERLAIDPVVKRTSDAIARWCQVGDFARLMNDLNAPAPA